MGCKFHVAYNWASLREPFYGYYSLIVAYGWAVCLKGLCALFMTKY